MLQNGEGGRSFAFASNRTELRELFALTNCIFGTTEMDKIVTLLLPQAYNTIAITFRGMPRV